MKTSQ